MESNTYLNIGSKGVAVLTGVDEVNKNLKISILGLTNEKKLIKTRQFTIRMMKILNFLIFILKSMDLLIN